MAPDAAQAKTVGNYELLGLIAEGGMGAVWRARHWRGGPIVAVKILPAETASNPLLLKRFEQEFKAATLIDHPNVVKALEYCGGGPTPFLVMEYVDGESLGQRVDRIGALAEAEALRLIGLVCEGLHRAHKQGLVHRDVKPDNILVTWEGVAKLTDLGLVKGVEAEINLTRTGRGLGTPHFMAPEQFRDAKNADVRCDVYSLGATLYTLVTGAVPFANLTPLDCWLRKSKDDFPAPRELNPALGGRFDWAVRRAMGADPKSRQASCREFMEDLTGSRWRGTGSSGTFPEVGMPGVSPGATPPPAPRLDDLWYLIYRDAAGSPHTVKGSTESVRKNVTAGTFGDLSQVLVSRIKTGQFVPLRTVPEFRDLVLPATGGVPAEDRMVDTMFLLGSKSNPPGAAPAPAALREPRPTDVYSDRELAEALAEGKMALEPPPFAPPEVPATRGRVWVVVALFVAVALASALAGWALTG